LVRGGYAVAKEIRWERILKKALSRGQTENKPILMFFHNPE